MWQDWKKCLPGAEAGIQYKLHQSLWRIFPANLWGLTCAGLGKSGWGETKVKHILVGSYRILYSHRGWGKCLLTVKPLVNKASSRWIIFFYRICDYLQGSQNRWQRQQGISLSQIYFIIGFMAEDLKELAWCPVCQRTSETAPIDWLKLSWRA